MGCRTYYYARVSSREQNLDRQILAFQSLGADERSIFTDHESGKNLERPQYQALKNAVLRKGDTLVIKSLDRLSRNKGDIYKELQFFKENNIRLKVIDLPTTMPPTVAPCARHEASQSVNMAPYSRKSCPARVRLCE